MKGVEQYVNLPVLAPRALREGVKRSQADLGIGGAVYGLTACATFLQASF